MKDATKSDLQLGIIIWLFLIAAAIGLISACAGASKDLLREPITIKDEGIALELPEVLQYVDTLADGTEIWCTKYAVKKNEVGSAVLRKICILDKPLDKT